MTKTSFRIEGLSDLDAALGDLVQSTSSATGKNVLRRVLRSAAEPIDIDWRANARRRSGQLADSGGVGSKLSRGAQRQRTKESAVEVSVGPGPLAQAIQEEFGNRHEAPHPYMRPAWDANKDLALAIITTDLGTEITRAADRAARKRAKAG